VEELDPGAIRGELPVHRSLVRVDGILPVADFAGQGFEVGDPAGRSPRPDTPMGR
jgi:hypothetical protein